MRVLVLAVASLLVAAASASATPGDLDRSFGHGGTVLTSFGAGEQATGQAVALARGNRIVVAGQLFTAAGDSEFALARYTSAGRLDRGFGDDGLVRTAFPGGARGFAVAVDRSGRIVVAGSSSNDLALARYTWSGRLDRSFGSGGKVTTAFPGRQVRGQAVVLLPAGGIAVAGGATLPDGTGQGFVLARYRADGSLDPRFGDQGRVFTPLGMGADVAAANALALRNGKLVAAGLLDNPFAGGGAFALARYHATNGSLDASFSGDGKVITMLGQEASAQGVLVLADGRIVAGGAAQLQPGQGDRFALTRYLADGMLDPSFGHAGVAITELPGGDAGANAIARQPDGRLVAVGQASQPDGITSIFGVVRYLRDGALDPTFGNGGIVTTSFGTGKLAAADGVAIQANGRILAVGGNGSEFALARYLGRAGRVRRG
jgi:uncharacterized delta-60 repeat protein